MRLMEIGRMKAYHASTVMYGIIGIGLASFNKLASSYGYLTGSWSVWSHAVTPHSTIYHIVFVI